MVPLMAHWAANLAFSPQFTPSAIESMELFGRDIMAYTSAIGSPEFME